MCPSLVEIRSVTSDIRRRKKEKTTAVKYNPLGIAMPCGLKCISVCYALRHMGNESMELVNTFVSCYLVELSGQSCICMHLPN